MPAETKEVVRGKRRRRSANVSLAQVGLSNSSRRLKERNKVYLEAAKSARRRDSFLKRREMVNK